MSDQSTSAPKDCTTCSFQYKCNKGKSMYCTLGNFPILNPEIGCHRHMYKSEFKSGNLYVTAKEIQAAKEAEEHNKFEI